MAVQWHSRDKFDRFGGVGASECPIVLGCELWGRRQADLQRQKLMREEQPITSAMRDGMEMEKYLMLMLGERTGLDIAPCWLTATNDRWSYCFASPDGLHGDTMVAEVKMVRYQASERRKEIAETGLTEAWRMQAIMQLVVTERRFAHVGVWYAPMLEMDIFSIDIDACSEADRAVADQCQAWYERHVVLGEPCPDYAGSNAQLAATRESPPCDKPARVATNAEGEVAHAYDIAVDQAAQAEANKRDTKGHLLKLLEDGPLIYAGTVYETRVSANGAVRITTRAYQGA